MRPLPQRTILIVAAALALCGLYVLVSRDRPSTEAVGVQEPKPASRSAANADLDADVAGQRVPAIDLSEPPRQDSPSDNRPAERAARLSGHFVFPDGSIPPDMSFQVVEADGLEGKSILTLQHEAERARQLGECVHWATDRSRPDGGFDVAGLCPGPYRISPSTYPGLSTRDALFQAPAEGVRVLLSGYILSVSVVQPPAVPVQGATVVAVLTQAGSSPEESAQARRLVATTDAQGRAFLCIPEPGEVRLHATSGIQYTTESMLRVDGDSGVIQQTLVLDHEHLGALLRVSLRSCDASATVIEHYCLSFYDAASGERSFRLCSEEIGDDGTFKGVRPGKYLVEASPRYTDPPVSYVPTVAGNRVAVELVDRQSSTLAFCVALGGRIALLVRCKSITSGNEVPATVEYAPYDSDSWAMLLFRHADATGVVVSPTIPPNVRRATERVLEPGSYRVRVKIEGIGTAERAVSINPGVTAEVDIDVVQEKH
jgi:hypothetical protein